MKMSESGTNNIAHVVHVIDSLAIGGMENGVVNLINTMPRERFRHSIVCVKKATDFRNRIRRNDVEIFELDKDEGKDPAIYLRFWKLLRRLRPEIVHTRNIGTLDLAPVAALAGVPIRVHGEHGWEASDLKGSSSRYRKLRRLCDPFIKSYIAVSRDIALWLREDIGISPLKIRQIYNGVDSARFVAADSAVRLPFPDDVKPFVFGFVGRMDPVKGLDTLIDAFASLIEREPGPGEPVRLVMVGDGPERERCMVALRERGLADFAWLPGRSEDISGIMRALDAFVLPSLNEGISNTILEAMATSLPIIATAVGGNPELIEDGVHGLLVPSGDTAAMARAMQRCIDEPEFAKGLGSAARQRVESRFSLDAMAAQYSDFYQYLQGPAQPGQKLRAA